MIIATIGHSVTLKLKDLDSAEALLRLLAEAESVNQTYIKEPDGHRQVWHESDIQELSIKVIHGDEVLSHEEFLKLKGEAA